MLDFIDKPINPPGPYKFNVITTFAGCGGSSLGYKWAGGKVLAAVEWEENAVDTYRLNHHGTHVLHRDIATVTAQELFDLTGLKPGELDIFDGSPPCQGFSTAGKRQIDDPRNSLFKEYVRLLRGLKPKVFVMENVSGMVKGDMKHVFAIAMRELKASGYQVKCQLMNTMYFGVPQSRPRVIFIGIRNDLNMSATHPLPHAKLITVAMALNNSPQEIPAPVLSGKFGELSKRLKQGQSIQDITGSYGHGNARLDVNKPSPTLVKTAMFGAPKMIHPTENRGLSISEAKRLASFPDAFQFTGEWKDAWARIGNSVPPRFMQAIAEHIYTHILSKVERIEEVVNA